MTNAQDKCHHYCETENAEKKNVLEYEKKIYVYDKLLQGEAAYYFDCFCRV